MPRERGLDILPVPKLAHGCASRLPLAQSQTGSEIFESIATSVSEFSTKCKRSQDSWPSLHVRVVTLDGDLLDSPAHSLKLTIARLDRLVVDAPRDKPAKVSPVETTVESSGFERLRSYET